MEYTIFLILAPIALGATVITIIALWRYRFEIVGQSLIAYFILSALFLIFNVFELIAADEGWTYFWASAQYPIHTFIPVSWIFFCLQFTKAKIPRIRLLFFFISVVPAITSLLAVTMPLHNFIYSEVVFHHFGGYSTVDPSYGIWFWFNGVHIYVLLIFGAVLSVRHIAFSGKVYRAQSFWILAGVILPLLMNVLYLLPLPFFLHKDYTPLAYAVSGFFFFVAIYWHRMLQIVPQARILALDTMEQALLILDTEKILVDFNSPASRMFSITSDDVGKTVEGLSQFSQVFGQRDITRNSSFEVSIAENGAKRDYDVTTKVIISADQDRPIGYLLTVSDISKRIQLLEQNFRLAGESLKANEELKQTQLQLIHREKLASIGQISAGLAHELKNPIGFMQSNLRSLRRRLIAIKDEHGDAFPEEDIEEIRSILDDSEEGFSRVLAVVDNLLQFSRPSDSEEKSLFDLEEGIETTLRIMGGVFESSDEVEIIREYGGIPPVVCHGMEINQVLLNLLTNAVHAVHNIIDGEKRISIRTSVQKSMAVCEVANNGMPIDPEIQERIFEPFFSTKDAGQGTGLGLSIARDIIVERHSGNLEVESNRRETLFRFTIPME